jgi:5-formyltetrahydrofolate cyclo-ligase
VDFPTQDRQNQRQRLIAAREALPAEQRLLLENALLQHLQSLLEQLNADHQHATLGFCWPFRGEPDLRPLVTTWLSGKPQRAAALPVVTARDAPLAFRRWTPESVMQPDRHDIPIPVTGDTLQASLLLIPVNGFDARGYRLGYGGGYFDRTLDSLDPAPQTIGIGFELGRLPHIAEEAHDRPLDWIVTEAGAFRAQRP